MEIPLGNRRGVGLIGAILWVGLLVLLILVLFQVVPPVWNRYELSLAFETTLEHATVSHTDEEIRQKLAEAFKFRKLDHNPANVEIRRYMNSLSLSYGWTVPIGVPYTPVVFYINLRVSRSN